MGLDMSETVGTDFHREMLALLPRLRGYAYSLTGDRDRADELVQGTVVRALARRETFRPGTNLAAWMFRIQRNVYIDGFRRQRPTVELNEEIAGKLSIGPTQEDALLKSEFMRAFAQLPTVQREALVLSVIEGQTYDEIAARAGVAVGTIKSRVSRARDRLLELMTGETARPAVAAEGRAPAPRAARSSRIADSASLSV